MRFLNLRLQDFRNIEFAELPLGDARNFLLGANGQGKSNLLEALGLATTASASEVFARVCNSPFSAVSRLLKLPTIHHIQNTVLRILKV